MGQPRLLVLDEPTEVIQPSIILEIEATVRNKYHCSERNFCSLG